MRAGRLRVALRLEGRNSQRDALGNQLDTPSDNAFRNIWHPKWVANPERKEPPGDRQCLVSYSQSSTDRQIIEVCEFDIRTPIWGSGK